MADTLTVHERSALMAKVRSSGNATTELRLIALFRRQKITGWRRRYRLFGSPDFVFPIRRVALFVDGCFWHGCPEHCRHPQSNPAYWWAKIDRNIKRDESVSSYLRAHGWKVVRIWEHQLSARNFGGLANELRKIFAE